MPAPHILESDLSYLRSLIRMDYSRQLKKRRALVAKFGEEADVAEVNSKLVFIAELYDRIHPSGLSLNSPAVGRLLLVNDPTDERISLPKEAPMWDRMVCYDCHEAEARFGCDKRDELDEYPDLDHDEEGWVRVTLCRDCATRWENDE